MPKFKKDQRVQILHTNEAGYSEYSGQTGTLVDYRERSRKWAVKMDMFKGSQERLIISENNFQPIIEDSPPETVEESQTSKLDKGIWYIGGKRINV